MNNISSEVQSTGQFIQYYRKEEMKISRQKLADLADVDVTTITSFEKGELNIRLGTLVRICKAMNLKLIITEAD